MIGSAQAFEAFKILMGKLEPSATLLPAFGVLQHFDFARNESRSLRIQRRKNCLCSGAKFSLEGIADIPLAPEECAYDGTRIFLDVREEKEWAEFHLPDIPNWALSRLESGDLPVHLKSQKITTVCLSGARAERAFRLLVDKGFDINFTRRSIYGLENGKR
jgi:rhodanese-related sulfurtransferase